MQDRRPPGPPMPPQQPPRPGTVLPPLDRSAPPPPVQLGPQKLDSAEGKLAVHRSLANSMIPVKFTQQFPCGVHPCLNYTNQAIIGYDVSYAQYRISIICP